MINQEYNLQDLGKVLQTARQERRLSIAQVVRELKFSNEYLELIERGELDQIPYDPEYNLHYLRSYARFLDVDISQYLHKPQVKNAVSNDSTANANTSGNLQERKHKIRRKSFSNSTANSLLYKLNSKAAEYGFNPHLLLLLVTMLLLLILLIVF